MRRPSVSSGAGKKPFFKKPSPRTKAEKMAGLADSLTGVAEAFNPEPAPPRPPKEPDAHRRLRRRGY